LIRLNYISYIFIIIFVVLVQSEVYSQNDSIAIELIKQYPKNSDIPSKKKWIADISDSLKKINNQKLRYYFLNAIITVSEKTGDFSTLSFTQNFKGNLYNSIGKYYDAIKTFGEARVSLNKANTSKEEYLNTLANIYMNTGNSYYYLNSYNKALENYKAALGVIKKKQKTENDDEKYAQIYNNLGISYHELKNFETSAFYFKRALQISTLKKDSIHMANLYCNIAEAYQDNGQINEALKLLKQAESIYKIMGTPEDNSYVFQNIGKAHLDAGNIPFALNYLNKSLNLTENEGESDLLLNIYKFLYLAHEKNKDPVNALRYFKLYNSVQDSVKKDEILAKLNSQELKVEFNLLHVTDSIKNFEAIKTKDIQISQKKKQSTYLTAILIIILIFLGIVYNRFTIIKKQKLIIEQQKKDLLDKHKEIRDSLNYAERIQRALLTSEKILNKNLSNYFILFKPKDVVSGDFYWATTLANSNFAFMTADSTGHGVPGAIMSILNISCLKEVVLKGHTSPDIILNETRKSIIENLKFDGSQGGGKDGMDGSLLSFDFKTKTLFCSSAYNSILIIKNGIISEIKGDRIPIGKHERDSIPYTLNTINLEKGDLIYTLTDGFADQFGFKDSKKFKHKRLKELLLSISKESMEKQKQVLNDAFESWRGNLDQVDDVTVIGIRV
jgi:serine phosphatase RsbU (regulator of sigma subunit)